MNDKSNENAKKPMYILSPLWYRVRIVYDGGIFWSVSVIAYPSSSDRSVVMGRRSGRSLTRYTALLRARYYILRLERTRMLREKSYLFGHEGHAIPVWKKPRRGSAYNDL